MFQLPNIKIPGCDDLKVASLSSADIKSLSDSELLQILSGEKKLDGIVNIPMQNLITSELHARAIAMASKPHWSVSPGFVLSVISLIASVLALYASFYPAQAQLVGSQVLDIFSPSQPAEKIDANSQPQLRNSERPQLAPSKK